METQMLSWWAAILLAVFLSFSLGCSGVQFSKDSASSSGAPGAGVELSGAADCADAGARGLKVTATQKIDFADPRLESGRAQVCDFGRGGNYSMCPGILAARYEQKVALNLPAKARVCSIRLASALQKFRYDDVFFLTFNGRILASNARSAIPRNVPEPYLYDWAALRGAPFYNQADDYCLGFEQGLAHCQWPVTEQAGYLSFQFSGEVLAGLHAPEQTVGFVVTGDDDAGLDCYHDPLSLTATIEYYIRP